MTIQIGNNVPINVTNYPFKTMNIGDSFLRIINDINEIYDNYITSLHNSAYEYGKRHDMKFTIKKVKEGYLCKRIL